MDDSSVYSYFIVHTQDGEDAETFDFRQARVIADQHHSRVIAVRLDGSHVALDAYGQPAEEISGPEL